MATDAQKVHTATRWTTVRIQWISGVGTFVFGPSSNLGVGKGFDFSGLTAPIKVTLAPGDSLWTWTDAPGGVITTIVEDMPLLHHEASP